MSPVPQQPNFSRVMNSEWHGTGDLCIFSFMSIYDRVHLTASWKKISIPSFDSPLLLSFASSPSHTVIKHHRFRHKRGAGLSSAKNCSVFDRKASRLGEHPSGAPLSLPYTARKESQHSRAYQALPQSNLWHELCVSADLSQAAGCWHAWKKKYSDHTVTQKEKREQPLSF